MNFLHKHQVFNLRKEDRAFSSEFIAYAQKYEEKKALIKVVPDQLGNVLRTHANIFKVHTLLGCKSKVAFKEEICRSTEWCKTACEMQLCLGCALFFHLEYVRNPYELMQT